jgi:HEAT repeat protein
MAIVKRKDTRIVQKDRRSRPRDYAGLIAALSDSNPMARRWAARDLAEFADAAAALAERLEKETEATVREAILSSLAMIGNPIAVGGLVRCLRSEDAALRNGAIEALKNLPEAVAPIMDSLLADTDPDVRIFAVNILESLRHPDIEKWLIKVIHEDVHVNVCATAADLLSEVGTEAAIDPLEALKQRFPDEPYIAFVSDLALQRIRRG